MTEALEMTVWLNGEAVDNPKEMKMNAKQIRKKMAERNPERTRIVAALEEVREIAVKARKRHRSACRVALNEGAYQIACAEADDADRADIEASTYEDALKIVLGKHRE